MTTYSHEDPAPTFDLNLCMRFSLAPDGRFIQVNQAALEWFGLTPETMQSATFLRYFPTEKAGSSFLMLASGSGVLSKHPLQLKRKGVEETHVVISMQANRPHERPEVTRYDVEMLDVTDLRLAEQQANRLQKMATIGEVTSGIAHDFNNLLAIITGYSEIILSEHPENPKLTGLIQEIARAGERGASLIKQILSFSRQQKRQATRQIVQPAVVLEDLRKTFARLCSERAKFQLGSINHDLYTKTDRAQLEQVLLNLLINSLDALPPVGGEICMGCTVAELKSPETFPQATIPPGRYALITVEDNGCGIVAENLNRIFEPFFTTKKQGEGTGIGLASSSKLIRENSGYLVLESEIGQGTTVNIYLPLVRRQQIVQEKKPANLKKAPGVYRILVVEDDRHVLQVIKVTLESCGYKVTVAGDAATAKDKMMQLKDERIDLLLCDIVLPDKHGPELAGELVQVQPGMLVIFMSGYIDRAAERYGLTSEHSNFLPKPFTLNDLAGKIHDTLDQSSII